MRFKIIIISLIYLNIVSCSNEKWVKASINNSKIEALFPIEPENESKIQPYPDGTIKAYMASIEYDGNEYSISSTTYGEKETFTKEMLYPGYMFKLGAKINEKNEVYLGLLSGFEYKMGLDSGKAIVRIFPDKNTIYNIIVIFEESKEKEAEKFLKSIKLN